MCGVCVCVRVCVHSPEGAYESVLGHPRLLCVRMGVGGDVKSTRYRVCSVIDCSPQVYTCTYVCILLHYILCHPVPRMHVWAIL